MEIEVLQIDIVPDLRPQYQLLHIKCRVNGEDLHTQEYFPRDDLHSTFDRMFDCAKRRIRQVLNTKYAGGAAEQSVAQDTGPQPAVE